MFSFPPGWKDLLFPRCARATEVHKREGKSCDPPGGSQWGRVFLQTATFLVGMPGKGTEFLNALPVCYPCPCVACQVAETSLDEMYTVETETDKGLVVVTLLIQARAIRSFSLAWGKIHQVPAGHRPGLKGLN